METEKKRKRDEPTNKHTKFEDNDSKNESVKIVNPAEKKKNTKQKEQHKKQKFDPAKLQEQLLHTSSSNWQQLQQKIAPPSNHKKPKFFRKKPVVVPTEEPKPATPAESPKHEPETNSSIASETNSESSKPIRDTKVICLVCNITPDVDPSTNTRVATSVGIYNYHGQPIYKVDVTKDNRNQVSTDIEKLIYNHVIVGYDLVKALDALFVNKDKGTYLRDTKTYSALHFPESDLPLGKLALKHFHRDEDIRPIETRVQICLDLYKKFKKQWEIDIQKEKEEKRKRMQEMQKEFMPKKKERINYAGKIFINKKPYTPKQRKFE